MEGYGKIDLGEADRAFGNEADWGVEGLLEGFFIETPLVGLAERMRRSS